MVFGVAGVPTNFKGKFKNLFEWLGERNLNGYEIQCVYGFKISEENKRIILENQKNGFYFSIHAPYYINLGSLNAQVVARSKANMKEGIELAKSINVTRIIFHPGGGHENTENGRKLAIKQLIEAVNEFTSEIDMENVLLYPEIGGKTANLGSLDEIIEICKNCKYCYPCIDIAHLHAREIGSLTSKEIIKSKLQKIKDAIPDKFEKIHFHAYTINYGENGEIKHLHFGDTMPDGSVGMPNLDDFISVLKEMNVDPYIISEALDSQELSAQYMHDLYIK